MVLCFYLIKIHKVSLEASALLPVMIGAFLQSNHIHWDVLYSVVLVWMSFGMSMNLRHLSFVISSQNYFLDDPLVAIKEDCIIADVR